MKTAIRTLASAMALSLATPLCAQPAVEDKAALDALVDGYVERGVFPVLYVRVEDRDGNIVYEHGVNNPELAPAAPVNGESWLRIWSMSKIVTISAALDMIEDGLLTFDDPVAKFIPEFKDLEVAVAPSGNSL
ncbi:MAG: serine hydrolase domain-containing protein, partial [Pseudomonadota bacterium]